MTPRRLARLAKVLSVENRVRIVKLLGGRTLCVNALASRLDVTQGAVSQHLRIMRDAGLVIDQREGYFVHYRLNERTLNQWRVAVGELLTPDHHPCQHTKGDSTCPLMNKSAAASDPTT